MRRQQTISVVIPAFEEEERIEATLDGIPEWVDFVVVVDDASRDATSERVRLRGESRVTLVRHDTNRGVGAAIATGTQRAFELGADVACVMAGDNQMDPDELTVVVDPILVGSADYVKGNRFLHADVKKMPRLRRWGSFTLACGTNLVADLDIQDSQCGYTALGRRAGLALPWDSVWPRYGYPNDLLVLLARRGFRISEVPVRPIYAGEKSGLRFWHVLTILGVLVRRISLELSESALERSS